MQQAQKVYFSVDVLFTKTQLTLQQLIITGLSFKGGSKAGLVIKVWEGGFNTPSCITFMAGKSQMVLSNHSSIPDVCQMVAG